MKKSSFIILSLLLCFSSFAQENWLCVHPNKKAYFEDTNKMVYYCWVSVPKLGESAVECLLRILLRIEKD